MSDNEAGPRKTKPWTAIAGWLKAIVHGHRRFVLTIMAALLVLTFLLAVWPTVWRYDHMNLGGSVYPVRINRLTGRTERLVPSGWSVMGGGTEGKVERLPLPATELAKITGNLKIEPSFHDGYINFHAYNGSAWTVTEITIELTAEPTPPRGDLPPGFKLDETVVSQRPYKLSGYALAPFNSGKFIERLLFEPEPGRTWSFRVVGAKGTK